MSFGVKKVIEGKGKNQHGKAEKEIFQEYDQGYRNKYAPRVGFVHQYDTRKNKNSSRDIPYPERNGEFPVYDTDAGQNEHAGIGNTDKKEPFPQGQTQKTSGSRIAGVEGPHPDVGFPDIPEAEYDDNDQNSGKHRGPPFIKGNPGIEKQSQGENQHQ